MEVAMHQDRQQQQNLFNPHDLRDDANRGGPPAHKISEGDDEDSKVASVELAHGPLSFSASGSTSTSRSSASAAVSLSSASAPDGCNKRLSLDALIAVEEAARHEPDFVALASLPACSTSAFDFNRRQWLCEWLYNFVDLANESRDIVHVAMGVYDRYYASILQQQQVQQPPPPQDTQQPHSREGEARVAIACLFIAIRIRGKSSMGLPRILELCRSAHTVPQIVHTGNKLLKLLSWQHRFIAPREFIAHILRHVKGCVASDKIVQIWENACFFAEVSVMDSTLIGVPASHIAMGCVFNTIADLGLCHYTANEHCSRLLRSLFGMSTESAYFCELTFKIKRAYLLTSECSHLVVGDEADHHPTIAAPGPAPVPAFGDHHSSTVVHDVHDEDDSDGVASAKRRFDAHAGTDVIIGSNSSRNKRRRSS